MPLLRLHNVPSFLSELNLPFLLCPSPLPFIVITDAVLTNLHTLGYDAPTSTSGAHDGWRVSQLQSLPMFTFLGCGVCAWRVYTLGDT